MFRLNNIYYNKSSFKTLIKNYGFPIAIYYVLLNESCVLVCTYLLYYDYISINIINDCLKYFNIENSISTNAIPVTIPYTGFEINSKLVINFAVSTAFMSLFTPIQIPFCVITFPYIKKYSKISFKKNS